MGGKESNFNWRLPLYGVIGCGIGLGLGCEIPFGSYTLSTLSICFAVGGAIGGAALGLSLAYLAKYEENKDNDHQSSSE